MKPHAFRIRNYKSIRDTGVCPLADDMTVLIGVNEAGKTAVLEALGDYDREAGPFSESVHPLDGSGTPTVSVGFILDEREWRRIVSSHRWEEALKDRLIGSCPDQPVWIVKDAAGRYDFDDETGAWILDALLSEDRSASPDAADEAAGAAADLIALVKQQGLDPTALEDLVHRPDADAAAVVEAVKNLLPRVRDEDVQNNLLAAVRRWIDMHTGDRTTDDPRTVLLEAMLPHMPRFCYYNDFKDTLPFEVDLVGAMSHPAVRDFVRLSGLDITELTAVRDVQRRYNILSRHTTTIAGDFLTHWRQNEVVLQIHPIGEKLVFGVREKDRPELFRVDQRSRGFQWFLSFYLKLHAVGGQPHVWLIDEPGMHLHAQAQRDILTIIQKVAAKDHVVYTTHSPYMIDPRRPDRIRVVVKDPREGTRLIGDVSRLPDEASWEPLRAAMDAELPVRIHPGRPVVVVVRPADYFYLRAMEQYLYSTVFKDLDVVTLPRIENIEMFVALLIARQTAFKILTPADERLTHRLQQALARYAVEPEQWVRAVDSDQAHGGLENLFTPNDRRRFLWEDGDERTPTGDGDASHDIVTEMTERGLNPDVVARRFYQRVIRRQDVVLEEATQQAFRDVFQDLVQGLKPWTGGAGKTTAARHADARTPPAE